MYKIQFLILTQKVFKFQTIWMKRNSFAFGLLFSFSFFHFSLFDVWPHANIPPRKTHLFVEKVEEKTGLCVNVDASSEELTKKWDEIT